MYAHKYIHIYIEREREGENSRQPLCTKQRQKEIKIQHLQNEQLRNIWPSTSSKKIASSSSQFRNKSFFSKGV